MADLESPFIKIKEAQIRMRAIFDFLQIGLKTPANQELFELALSYRHERIIAACCRIIQIINNHDYASWWTLNLSFYDLQKESAIPKGKDDNTAKYVATKIAITDQMDKIAAKLKDYEARLFADVRLKQALVDQELKKISLYPERMAQTFPGFENAN